VEGAVKLQLPLMAFTCLRNGCKKEFHPDVDEYGEGDWSKVNAVSLGALLLALGWVIEEEGYTFCSAECKSKYDIESDDDVRRIRWMIHEIVNKQEATA
jgi:hypothetical protein